MTLAREGGFQPAVEQLFSSLLEREPHDVELRYALASYYRRSGMAARAILQLRLVLSADSGHAGAWRDLGSWRRADAAGSLSGGLSAGRRRRAAHRGRDAQRLDGVEVGALARRAAGTGEELAVLDPDVAGLASRRPTARSKSQ